MKPIYIIAFSVYGLCFILYHSVYLFLTARNPSLTKKGRINRSIGSWLKAGMEENQYLLVVHQLRNLIISITFLSSTAVLLIGFLLSYGLTESVAPSGISFISSFDYPVWLAFFTFGYALLSLLIALRHFNNLTVLIRSSPEQLEKIEGKPALEYLEKLYIKGSQNYMMGRRGFLYAIITLFWYVDTWVFVGLTVLLTVILSCQHDF